MILTTKSCSPAIALAFCLVSSLAAQTVRGRLDQYSDRGVIPFDFATLRLISQTGKSVKTRSQSDGMFRFDGVKAGDYVLRVEPDVTQRAMLIIRENPDLVMKLNPLFGVAKLPIQYKHRVLPHSFEYNVSVVAGRRYTDIDPILVEDVEFDLKSKSTLSSGVIAVTGKHTLPAGAPLWVFTQDADGAYFLQCPPAVVADDGSWTSDSVRLRSDTKMLLAVLITDKDQAAGMADSVGEVPYDALPSGEAGVVGNVTISVEE